VADTPGLREVGLWGIEVREVAHCFPELRPYLGQCRFADCTHLVEPGCAIRDAVDAGTVSRARWESYGKLREELASAAGQLVGATATRRVSESSASTRFSW
jgi:ribosome biogenesis GTPase / thiamine phosphate phosphatase